MKKNIGYDLCSGPVLFGNIIILRILFYLILLFTGYKYVPNFLFIQLIIDTIIILFISIYSVRSKNDSTLTSVYVYLLPLLAFIYSTLKLITLGYPDSLDIYIYTYVIQLCSWIVFFKNRNENRIKRILNFSYTFLISILHFLYILILIASILIVPMTSERLYSQSVSLNSKYIVYITIHNSGATGGSTHVSVKKNTSDIDILFGILKPATNTLYIGRWGEEQQLDIHWKGEDLYIKGIKHKVKF